MNKRDRKKIEGISMVEVIFAVAILAVGALALMGQMETSYKANNTNRETNKAMAHLSAALEKVVNVPFSRIVADFPDQSAITLPEINSTDLLAGEQITVHYSDTEADPLEITTTISWTSFDGRARTRSLTTIVSR